MNHFIDTSNDDGAPAEADRVPLLTGPKRQHFLPRFYLKGFTADDDLLSVYDRTTGEVRRQAPDNTAVTGHLYTLTDDQGRKRFELEAALAAIEAAASNHLPTLIKGAPLSEEARGALSYFFAAMAVRTPEFIQSIQHANGQLLKRVSQMLFSTPQQAMIALRARPDNAGKSDAELFDEALELADFMEEDDFEVTTAHSEAVLTALPLADTVAPIFFSRSWTVLEAPRGSSFVTTDAAMMLTSLATRPHRFGLGHGSPDALTVLPLSSGHAIAMFGSGPTIRRWKIDTQKVREINISLADRAQRFLFARDDRHAAAIGRAARMTEKTWRPRFHVG
ncbi:DUF4238 domain-containing protein [Xanthomonas citri]|uniref:DUF4238 domain-containing protein n=1 Tax=Xanthomonas citri TaxID=346 RepID=UPI00188541F0|nr:DUF4238 domain-containing protein [Xanthomonas citri]QOY23235.1 DUF4238 domain-containing protein [Xanthomonas citri]QQK69396.1 DUF4238 domain-containing protein [Xanthomonas citri]